MSSWKCQTLMSRPARPRVYLNEITSIETERYMHAQYQNDVRP